MVLSIRGVVDRSTTERRRRHWILSRLGARCASTVGANEATRVGAGARTAYGGTVDKIFVSYRRSDRHAAGLLRSEVERRLGSDRVFMDTNDLDAGEGFPERLLREIMDASVVLVVIGKGWASEVERLDDPEDWVRREIVEALSDTRTVVPVVLDDAELPDIDAVPPELAALLQRQSYRIDSSHLERDIDGLLEDLSLRRSRRGLLLGTIALVAVAGLAAWLLWPSNDHDDLSFLNTQLIFDTSAGMTQLMPAGDGAGTRTKEAAAREQVSRYIELREDDKLALRAAGRCGDSGELLVPFQRSAASSIDGSLREQAFTGSSFPLSAAILAATGDFSDPEVFPPDLVQKQIIVFTASGDGCAEAAAQSVAERAAELGDIRLELEIIGLGVEPGSDEARELDEIAAAAGGRAFPVSTEEELEEVLEAILEIEPVVAAASEISAIGNSIVGPLNDLTSGANGCRAEEARVAATATAVSIEQSRPALGSLAGRDQRASYVAIHDAGLLWAEALAATASQGDDLIDLVDGIDGRDDPACDEVRSSDEWNESVDSWDELVAEADTARNSLRDAQSVLEAEIAALLEQ